jgi:hypothetical protein
MSGKLFAALLIILFVAGVGFVLLANLKYKKMASDRGAFHKQLGLIPVNDFPLQPELRGAAGTVTHWESSAYQFPKGEFAGGYLIYNDLYSQNPADVRDPVEHERIVSGVRHFITLHIPQSRPVSDEWIAAWQAKVDQKLPHPRRHLSLIKRMPDGSVQMRWEADQVFKDWVMAILKDTLGSLPRTPQS